jgi:hypothetical protein
MKYNPELQIIQRRNNLTISAREQVGIEKLLLSYLKSVDGCDESDDGGMYFQFLSHLNSHPYSARMLTRSFFFD